MRTRRLIVVTPEGDRELLFIGRLTIGRAPECDISLADTKISRRHAEFDASGPLPRVTDLGSRNGILVNGRKVGAADLVPGDVVTVGDASIRFEERAAQVSEPVAPSPVVEDGTAIFSPLSPMIPPVPEPLPAFSVTLPPAVPPPLAPPAPLPPEPMDGMPGLLAGLEESALAAGAGSDSEKTNVPPPPVMHAAMSPVAPPFDPSTERTTLLPPPRPPVAASQPVDANPAVKTVGFAGTPPIVAAPPTPAVPSAPLSAPSTPSVPAPLSMPPFTPPSTPPAASQSAAAVPAVAPATPAAPSAGIATGSALKGPRFSWGGLVTVAALLLGALAVLLGALSASSSALDALSRRQARTLAGWLAAGVDPQASTVVDPTVMEAVLAQPGVERAMVLERSTGRAMAPSALGGRAYSALPGLGEAWRDLTSAHVSRVDAFADAYVPAGGGAYIVWVRYERPSYADTGLAIIVPLIATLAFALLIALLIKRHTRATLQHFTRQVELAVSGASPKVMQGGLLPGLEGLAGVVTYLLEQRRAGGVVPAGGHASGPTDADEPLLLAFAPPIDPGPPWLEVTPSLMVAGSSVHGPVGGATGWSNARGRHLLDVLDNGPVSNAVVQGLGALSMQSGSEATVPLPGGATFALRRESSGHVRVTLGAR